MNSLEQTFSDSHSRPLSADETQSGRKHITTLLYAYFHFILVLILTTNSELTLKSDLLVIHLAGVENPLILLIFVWLVWKVKSGLRSFPRTAVDWTIVAMITASILSMLFSSNKEESAGYILASLLFVGFFYFSLDMINTRQRLEHIVMVVLMSGVVVIGFNFQYLYQNDFCTLGVLERYPFWTGKSPMGYYNTFLIAFIMGLLLFGWKSTHKWVNVTLIMLTIGATVSLFFSFSRSSWLTALFIVFLAASQRFGRTFLIGLLILLLFMGLLFQDVIGNIGLAIYNINSGNVDDRVYIWKSALDMLRDHPLTGVGAGTFNINYLQWYQLLESLRWNDSYHAHNVFLHTAAEQGYIGLIAFLLFWGVVFRQIFLNFHLLNKTVDKLLKGMNTAVFLGLVNYFLWSLINTSISNVTKSFYNINLLTWFLTALVFCIPRIQQQQHSATLVSKLKK